MNDNVVGKVESCRRCGVDMAGKWFELSTHERGATLVEGALLVVLVALLSCAALQSFGQKTHDSLCRVAFQVTPPDEIVLNNAASTIHEDPVIRGGGTECTQAIQDSNENSDS